MRSSTFLPWRVPIERIAGASGLDPYHVTFRNPGTAADGAGSRRS